MMILMLINFFNDFINSSCLYIDILHIRDLVLEMNLMPLNIFL